MTLIAVEIDATTGEAVERPFTDEERDQRAADMVAAQAAAEAAAQAEAEAQAARDTALAKLAALGLTVDDLTALGL